MACGLAYVFYVSRKVPSNPFPGQSAIINICSKRVPSKFDNLDSKFVPVQSVCFRVPIPKRPQLTQAVVNAAKRLSKVLGSLDGKKFDQSW